MSLSPPSQDWMVLQCGSCSTRMKVRREVALESRLLCPKCHAPVPVAQEDAPASQEEFRPAPLPERPLPESGAPRSVLPQREDPVLQGGALPSRPASPSGIPAPGAHPEFDGRLPESAGDDESGGRLHPEERRRVRIKKRKTRNSSALRYLELTDWDQSDLTHIPEAETAADIWAEARPIPEDVEAADEENEYLVETVDDDSGQTRTTKKKVRRRRLLLGFKLFFLRFTALSRYLTATLALLVAGVAVYGVYVFRQKYQAPPLPPVEEVAIDRSVLTSYDEIGAEKAVRDFLAADGIEAKLAFVRQPQRIRPLMQKWYRDERTAGPLQAGLPTLRQKTGGTPGSEGYYVMLGMPVFVPDPLNPGSTYEEMTFFAVEEIRNGPVGTYLVDWETSTGYQEMPLETYKATMPPDPYPFRIFMKNMGRDGYYNHGFSELEWQCVELYYPGRNFHLFGYISRTTQAGHRLLDLVQGENGKAGIIAELVYPPDAASRDQVIVKRLIHPTWFYARPEDAAVLGDPIETIKSN